MLYVLLGNIQVSLQQHLNRSLKNKNNTLHHPFAALARLHPSLDMLGESDPDLDDHLLAHLVFYTAFTKGFAAAADLSLRRSVAL